MVRINSKNRTLSHFLCWIKFGKLDFDFFNVEKSSESLTQSFFRPEKTFVCGKADLVIS